MRLSTFDAFKHISDEENILVAISQEQLDKIHTIVLEIADDIIEMCEQNNICYFLGGGSTLGALRHQGFIPWDDDIDINMPRKDYDKFIPLFCKRYADKYWVQTPQNTSNYGLSITKIRKKHTVMRGRDDFHSSQCGVSVDIFVIENMYDNRILRTMHGILCLGMGFLLSCRKFYRDRKELMRLSKSMPGSRNVFLLKIAIGCIFSVFSLDALCRATDNVHRLCKNADSKYVSGCAGRLHFFGEMYVRERFCVVRKAMFEKRCWNIPVDAEGYLQHCYGDWKKIPEEEQREKHYVFEMSLEEK